MNEPVLYLYDDETARGWQPFALTRPVGELLFGMHTMRQRAERLVGGRCAGHITSSHLTGFEEPDAAPVVDASLIDESAPRLYLNSRFVADAGEELALPAAAATLTCGGVAVGWFAPAGSPGPEPGWLTGAPDGDGAVEVGGRVLGQVWELVSENARQLLLDWEAVRRRGAQPERAPAAATIGESHGMLRVGSHVIIEPNVVLDFSDGPICLADGATVRAFTRIAGPAFIGRGTTLLGGPFAAVSVGAGCKVHGEVEETVVLGYSNKAHDGFLGHAYLGCWVNLGAMTTNSDLKNNYGTIRLWTPAGEADTGLMKLGCLLGDHVKTGIGALLNTGTVIGAGSNLYGTAMPPRYVPPFSWGSGTELVAYDVEKFLDVAGKVMARRQVELSDGMRSLLRAAWHAGREQQ
jgi:UDP-N-acetylglucosamine diphosphorylase / glucose-1-phosphate thymidylyltransferase / UDP-N-acetylgalactosamine diphosphorylase / glucosamine-1-phosphate N-acetyltransferase / galactosamine-1-phosphate N-acetyltransferase